MIQRQNYLDVKAYLKYQREIKQVSPLTERANWCRLRHLIEWADDRIFGRASSLKPTFTTYVEGLMVDDHPFSSSHLTAICKTCRAFYTWAKKEFPSRYKAITSSWVESLRPSRGRAEQSELKTREIYTEDDIRALVAVPALTTAQRRMRAGVAFLFLSAMRIGAFVTLPINCVDVGELTVLQLPAKGVKTKNSKAAKTFMLNIPDLLKVVLEWDAEVRAALPPTAYWYANLSQFGELTTEMPSGDRVMRRVDFRESLVDLCERAGIPYRSPHKLRHGFAVYALKRARTVAQMKAVSQNLMHSNMGITDGIYGKLVDDDVKDIITGL